MKYLFPLIVLATLTGCSAEPEPTVGDAPIAKGVVRHASPKPPQNLIDARAASMAAAAKTRGSSVPGSPATAR